MSGSLRDDVARSGDELTPPTVSSLPAPFDARAHLARLFDAAERVPIRPRWLVHAYAERAQRMHHALGTAIALAQLSGLARSVALGNRRAWWLARNAAVSASMGVQRDVAGRPRRPAKIVDLALERARRAAR